MNLTERHYQTEAVPACHLKTPEEGTSIMAKRNADAEIKTARSILAGMAKFATPLGGDITADKLQNTVNALQSRIDGITGLKKQLIDQQNERDRIAGELGEMNRRVRAQVVAQFGDDSTEKELVGLKRASERRRPRLKAGAGA